MTPEEVIRLGKGIGIKKFVGLVSGGKDSIAASHIVSEMGLLDEVVFIDTTIGIPETQEFVIKFCEKQVWKLNILKPRISFEQFVDRYGFPRPGSHSWVMRYLKMHPLSKFATKRKSENIGFISGARMKESRRRMKYNEPITQSKSEGLTFVSPLYDKTTKWVWNYIRSNNLDVSPVYKTLHLSGDCLCGAFSNHAEAELISMFYPDVAKRISKIEAGCKKRFNTWGKGSSMENAITQKRLETFICSDCEINDHALTETK